MLENNRSFFTLASTREEWLAEKMRAAQRTIDADGVLTYRDLLKIVDDPSSDLVGRDDRGWTSLEGFDISRDPDEIGKFVIYVPFPTDLPKED